MNRFPSQRTTSVPVGGASNSAPRRSYILIHALRLLLLPLAAVAAAAQPVPKINSVSPGWIQRGTTVGVSFAGENLGGVTNFIISGDPGLAATITPAPDPGIRVESSQGGIAAVAARNDKTLQAKIAVTTNAPLGQREIRLVGAAGVSNPIALNIGQLPEVTEKSPNQSVEQAQRLDLPVAINGRIGSAAEIDYYRFTGKKGELVVFDVFGSRLGSAIDPSLAVLDKAGKELARSEDANGLDPLLVFNIPDDSEYVLQLRDFRYQGDGNFRYRLLAGAMPYVYSVFPFGGRRGQSVEIEVRGHNFASPRIALQIDPSAAIGRQDLHASTPRGLSNPFPFDVTDLAEYGEKEPNNQPGQASEVVLPSVLNGRIQTEKDRDVFKFNVQKDQRFIFEVLANRFGSTLDVLLTLADKNGKVIERNDDAVGADARIERSFTEAGEYVAIVEDLLGRGGDNFGYRLSIRPPQADFLVRFLPDNPRINRGGHASVRCELTRLNGFNETVRVAFAELPSGIFSEPVLLTPSAPAGALLILSAAKDCPLGTFPIKLEATTVMNGKPVGRAAEPLSSDKTVKEAFLSVLDQPPFTLDLATLTMSLDQGQSATVEVVAQRRDGYSGEIKLSAEGFSAGRDPVAKSFEVQPVSLKGAESRALVNLKAKFDSELGTRPILIKGESVVNGQTNIQYSSAIPTTIRQVPFVLAPTLTRLSVTALPSGTQSAAREAVFAIKADRRAGFTNEITLALEGLPDGITGTIDKVPANANETTVKLVATEKATAGKEFSLRVTGVGQFNDRTYRHRPGEIKLTVNAPGEAAQVATVGAK